MELLCDGYRERPVPVLDPTVREFQPRRAAAAAAPQRINDIAEQEELKSERVLNMYLIPTESNRGRVLRTEYCFARH